MRVNCAGSEDGGGLLKRFAADCALSIAHLWPMPSDMRLYLIGLSQHQKARAIQEATQYKGAFAKMSALAVTKNTNEAKLAIETARIASKARAHQASTDAVKSQQAAYKTKQTQPSAPIPNNPEVMVRKLLAAIVDGMDNRAEITGSAIQQANAQQSRQLECLLLTALLWPHYDHRWGWLQLGRREQKDVLCTAALRLNELSCLTLSQVEYDTLVQHLNIPSKPHSL